MAFPIAEYGLWGPILEVSLAEIVIFEGVGELFIFLRGWGGMGSELDLEMDGCLQFNIILKWDYNLCLMSDN